MPPRPAPMIVTVVAFAGWFMRGSLQRSAGPTTAANISGNQWKRRVRANSPFPWQTDYLPCISGPVAAAARCRQDPGAPQQLHAAQLQRLEHLPAVADLDGVRGGRAAIYRLALSGGAWPENELEVLALDADGQEPRSVRCRAIDSLLEAKDVRVEVERLVLVLNEHAYV